MHAHGAASVDSLQPFQVFETKPLSSIIWLAEKHLQSFSRPARRESVMKGDHTDGFLSTQENSFLTLAAYDFQKKDTK